MAAWTEEELQKIGSAKEIGIASRRADGTMRRFVTIWAVRVGDAIYVRSAYGPDNPWYRRAIASGDGRILAGDVERDVAFESADPSVHDDVDSAYHEKYDRHGARLVATVVGGHVHALTIRVVPNDAS